MGTRPLKRLNGFLRYYLLRGLIFLVGLLPLEAAKRLGAALAGLGFRLAGGERRKALESLSIAFPELPEAERLALARCSFEHLGRFAAEMCSLHRIDPILEQYVEVSDADLAVFRDALAESHGCV